MIVVCDTSPIRYLAFIGRLELLPALYGSIIIPPAVWSELHAESTPSAITHFLQTVPPWIQLRAPQNPHPNDPAFALLDLGETEAIQLARELDDPVLLMDDRDGRALALRLGLPVTGTLGVLERADTLNLLDDFPAVLEALRESGFYLSDRLRTAALDRHRLRHNPRL